MKFDPVNEYKKHEVYNRAGIILSKTCKSLTGSDPDRQSALKNKRPNLRQHATAYLPYAYCRELDWISEFMRWRGEKFDVILGSAQDCVGRVITKKEQLEFHQAYKEMIGDREMDLKEVISDAGSINTLLYHTLMQTEMHLAIAEVGGRAAATPRNLSQYWVDIRNFPEGCKHVDINLTIQEIITTKQAFRPHVVETSTEKATA